MPQYDKDSQSKKANEDFNSDEAQKRIQEESVLLTLEAICADITTFVSEN